MLPNLAGFESLDKASKILVSPFRPQRLFEPLCDLPQRRAAVVFI
jgi:hypothetical protein